MESNNSVQFKKEFQYEHVNIIKWTKFLRLT